MGREAGDRAVCRTVVSCGRGAKRGRRPDAGGREGQTNNGSPSGQLAHLVPCGLEAAAGANLGLIHSH
jgi:hypothetical protein